MKDYNKMRSALACYEAERMPRSELYEMLLFGIQGYDKCPDDKVEIMFINRWGKKQIPILQTSKK